MNFIFDNFSVWKLSYLKTFPYDNFHIWQLSYLKTFIFENKNLLINVTFVRHLCITSTMLHVTKYFYEGNTVHVIYVPCISVMTLQWVFSGTIWQNYIWVYTNSHLLLIVIVMWVCVRSPCKYIEYSKLVVFSLFFFDKNNWKTEIRFVHNTPCNSTTGFLYGMFRRSGPWQIDR